MGHLQRGRFRREEPGSSVPWDVAGYVPLLATDPQGTLPGRQSAPQQHPPLDHIRRSVQGLILPDSEFKTYRKKDVKTDTKEGNKEEREEGRKEGREKEKKCRGIKIAMVSSLRSVLLQFFFPVS